jgi:hypothetical protein
LLVALHEFAPAYLSHPAETKCPATACFCI